MPRQPYLRQVEYRQGSGGVGIPGIGGAGAANAPAVGRTAGLNLVESLGDAGQKLLGIAADQYKLNVLRKAESAAAAVEREFEEWKAQYRREKRGIDAIEAQRDFTRKYEELAGRALGGFGHENEQGRRELARNLAGRGLFAIREGAQWQAQQTREWERSHWQSRVSGLMGRIEENPADGGAIAFERDNLARLLQNLNPGRDMGHVLDDLDRTIVKKRMSALLARDETLGMAEDYLGKLASREAASGGGLPAEAAKHVEAAAAKTGVDRDLLMAVCMVESGGRQACVSRAGAIGYMQLMPDTAKELGVDPHDPAQNAEGGGRYLAMLLKRYDGDRETALLAYNWGMGNVDAWLKTGRGSRGQKMPDEAREYAAKVKSHMAGGGGADAAFLRQAAGHLEARKREAAENGMWRSLEQWFGQAADMASQEAAAFIAGRLAEVGDMKTRQRMTGIAESELAQRRRARTALAGQEASAWLEQMRGQNKTTVEIMAELRHADISGEARGRVADWLDGLAVKKTRANEDALYQAKKEIDLAGALATRDERIEYAVNNHLTLEQQEELVRYDGRMAAVSPMQVEAAAKRMGWKGQTGHEFFKAVENMLEPGQKATEAQAADAIARLILSGQLAGRGASYFEAVRQGRAFEWLPEVRAGEEAGLAAALRGMGLPATVTNFKLMKRRLMGLPVTDSQFQTEADASTYGASILSEEEAMQMGGLEDAE